MPSKTKHSTSPINIVFSVIVIVLVYRVVKDYLDNRHHDIKKHEQTNENTENVEENQQDQIKDNQDQIEENQEQIQNNTEAINELKSELKSKIPVTVYILIGILGLVINSIFFSFFSFNKKQNKMKSVTKWIVDIAAIMMIVVLIILFLLPLFESESKPLVYSVTTVIGIIALSILIYYWLYNKIKIKLPFFQKEIELGGHIFESKVYATSNGAVFALPTLRRAKNNPTFRRAKQHFVQDLDKQEQYDLGTKQRQRQHVHNKGLETIQPTENKQNFF